MDSKTFTLHVLPPLANKHDLEGLAPRFREFRLHALKSSPEAFASSYESESQRDLQHTIERLQNPKAVHIIATAQVEADGGSLRAHAERKQLANASWVGMIVLLGPEQSETSPTVSARVDPFSRMTSSAHTSSNRDDSSIETHTPPTSKHYHLNAVFVDPVARKAGLGKALIDAALGVADKQASGLGSNWTCSILVDSENTAARRLYEKAGFVVTGAEAYTQQPRALMKGESETRELTALHMEVHREPSQ